MSAGKEKKLPPPATEFMVPASTAASEEKDRVGESHILSGDREIG